MKRYNPSDIELKWQSKWDESRINVAKKDDNLKKMYVSGMFPYPSGLECILVTHSATPL